MCFLTYSNVYLFMYFFVLSICAFVCTVFRSRNVVILALCFILFRIWQLSSTVRISLLFLKCSASVVLLFQSYSWCFCLGLSLLPGFVFAYSSYDYWTTVAFIYIIFPPMSCFWTIFRCLILTQLFYQQCRKTHFYVFIIVNILLTEISKIWIPYLYKRQWGTLWISLYVNISNLHQSE